MARTLLQLVQAACSELSLSQPSQVFGATDQQTIQMLALMQRVGYEIARQPGQFGGWPQLRGEWVFNTAGVSGYTGTFTASSALITAISPNTTGITAGMNLSSISGPNNAAVLSVDSSSQVTLDTAASSTATGATLAFGTDNYTPPTGVAFFANTTIWDRAKRWMIDGPLDPQEWQVVKSGLYPTGPRYRFRLMSGKLYLDPVPTSVGSVALEYYANTFCQSSGGTAQSLWAADTDTSKVPEELFIYGLKWRFLRAKGLDADSEYTEYRTYLDMEIGRAGMSRDLPMNGTALGGMRLISTDSIPDTGWGQS